MGRGQWEETRQQGQEEVLLVEQLVEEQELEQKQRLPERRDEMR